MLISYQHTELIVNKCQAKELFFLVQNLFFVFLKEIFPKKKKKLCEKSRYFFLSFFMSELALHVRTLNLHTVGPHDL